MMKTKKITMDSDSDLSVSEESSEMEVPPNIGQFKSPHKLRFKSRKLMDERTESTQMSKGKSQGRTSVEDDIGFEEHKYNKKPKLQILKIGGLKLNLGKSSLFNKRAQRKYRGPLENVQEADIEESPFPTKIN